MKVSKSEREEALARLREWMPRGSTVHTICRHVSRSGMQREIGLVVIRVDGKRIETLHPNNAASKVLGWRLSKDRDALIVGGCGMNMGFHTVYELAAAIHGDGYALSQEWL